MEQGMRMFVVCLQGDEVILVCFFGGVRWSYCEETIQ